MNYDRTVLAYHGCDATTADALLAGTPFQKSENHDDWLGEGVYFWEYGADRARRFAEFQRAMGKVTTPAVVGAIVQLGACFDLMDTRHTRHLDRAYALFKATMARMGEPLPKNRGKTPDRKLRHRDCAVLNHWFGTITAAGGRVDTVRCAFLEGKPAFPGSGIRAESHIQIAVRNPACILGVFRPTLEKR